MVPRVVLTDHVFPEESLVSQVREHLGAELEIHECLDEAGLIEITRNADVVLLERAPITKNVIQQMRKARVIIRHGVGYDSIDVKAATEAGIMACNVTDYCTQEVADHAIAMLLALARSLFPLDREVRSGGWDVFAGAGKNRRIDGMNLGVIGFGNIGRAAGRRGAGFGMKVLAYDPYMDEAKIAAGGGKKVELEELLRESDMVTIHAPLWDETRHLLDETRLRMMKPTAYLVNTSRGGTVDQTALAKLLTEGKLAGAGLDVFEKEPPSLDDAIMKLPNVILSPHAAFYSTASLDEMHRRMATQAADVLAGKRPNNLVNPEVLSRLNTPLV